MWLEKNNSLSTQSLHFEKFIKLDIYIPKRKKKLFIDDICIYKSMGKCNGNNDGNK